MIHRRSSRMILRNFSTYSLVRVIDGRPERNQSPTDISPLLKREKSLNHTWVSDQHHSVSHFKSFRASFFEQEAMSSRIDHYKTTGTKKITQTKPDLFWQQCLGYQETWMVLYTPIMTERDTSTTSVRFLLGTTSYIHPQCSNLYIRQYYNWTCTTTK